MFHESIAFKKYSKRLHNLLLSIFAKDLKDPLFRRISVNHVRLNRNRTFAQVYLDLMSIREPEKRELIIRRINGLEPLFRNSLGNHLDRYRVPRLRFLEDKVFERGRRIEELLEDHGKGD